MKNAKATTLQFESDFDFETANAQFKDDLTKEVVGTLIFVNLVHITKHFKGPVHPQIKNSYFSSCL